MKDFYEAIYLSPHLDDAALSCGGQIFARTAVGQSVLVVTVMAGDAPPGLSSPIIDELHGRWQVPNEVVAVRREEDRAACRVLGADWLHWPALDCVYRMDPETGEPLYPTWEAVIGGVHPVDAVLVAEVAGLLEELPGYGRLLTPMGIGNHADHLVVRQAAQQAGGEKLAFYEDYPYAAAQSLAGNDNEWRLRVVPLTPAALQARFEAIAAYKSQLSTFFQDRADLEQQVEDFVKRAGGERIWYPTAVTR